MRCFGYLDVSQATQFPSVARDIALLPCRVAVRQWRQHAQEVGAGVAELVDAVHRQREAREGAAAEARLRRSSPCCATIPSTRTLALTRALAEPTFHCVADVRRSPPLMLWGSRIVSDPSVFGARLVSPTTPPPRDRKKDVVLYRPMPFNVDSGNYHSPGTKRYLYARIRFRTCWCRWTQPNWQPFRIA